MEIDAYSRGDRVELPVLKPAAGRAKSSQRMKYEAEIRLFKQTYGGLEDVRLRLGLSRRKICQLLLVDPSAWTRWSRDSHRVPPHIFRALEWYIALNEREPGRSLVGGLQRQWRTDLEQASAKIEDLAREFKAQKGVSSTLLLIVAVSLGISGYLLFLR